MRLSIDFLVTLPSHPSNEFLPKSFDIQNKKLILIRKISELNSGTVCVYLVRHHDIGALITKKVCGP